MHFSEEVFLYSLTTRSEDAKRFSRLFKPAWLQTVQYRPILAEIYEFTKANDIPPNVKVLREIFKKKDPAQYKVRYSKALDKIGGIDPPEISEIIYTLDQAKDVAVSWSLKELIQSAAFKKMNEDFEGGAQIRAMEHWIQQFLGRTDDVELTVKEAIQQLISERGWLNKHQRILCGIKPIDELTGNGIRPPGLGIIMAPTGAGKTNCLTIMSHKVAAVEQKRVLLITNELAMFQITERTLSAITGENLTQIQEDPIHGYKGLERHWASGLGERLRLVEVLREITADDIEAMVSKYINLYGWAPEVVVIDYMERMKPCEAGVKRDQTWNWYENIAKDLIRVAKKNNWLIWTACQTNRAGLSAKVQDMSQGQGSIKHFQEATYVVGVQELDAFDNADSNVKILQFTLLKARESKRPPAPILVEARFDRMEISNRRRSIQELIQDGGVDVSRGSKKDDPATPRQRQKARQNK